MEKFYRTQTLDIGAFLMASGINFINCETLYGQVYNLVFENPEECRKLEALFYSGAKEDAQKLLASKAYLMREINKMKGGK